MSGEFSTDKAIKEHKAKVVIIGTDASDNTKKAFMNSCNFYKVDCYEYSTKEDLGHCLGKEQRAVIGITDDGFANSVRKLLDD